MSKQSKEKSKAIIALVILVLTLVNSGLQLAGYDTIPINNEKVELVLTLVSSAGASVYAWWKNQNVTKEAVQSQEYLNELKDFKKLNE